MWSVPYRGGLGYQQRPTSPCRRNRQTEFRPRAISHQFALAVYRGCEWLACESVRGNERIMWGALRMGQGDGARWGGAHCSEFCPGDLVCTMVCSRRRCTRSTAATWATRSERIPYGVAASQSLSSAADCASGTKYTVTLGATMNLASANSLSRFTVSRGTIPCFVVRRT